MNHTVKLIRDTTKLSISKFAEDKMKLNEKTFRYRLANGVLKLEDYHKICHYTGLTFEQLWPSPYEPAEPKTTSIPKALGTPITLKQPKAEDLTVIPEGYTQLDENNEVVAEVAPVLDPGSEDVTEIEVNEEDQVTPEDNVTDQPKKGDIEEPDIDDILNG